MGYAAAGFARRAHRLRGGGLLLREDGETVEAAGLAIAPNMATYGLAEGRAPFVRTPSPAQVAAVSGALMMVRRDEFLALGGSTRRSSCTGKRPITACEYRGGSSFTLRAR